MPDIEPVGHWEQLFDGQHHGVFAAPGIAG